MTPALETKLAWRVFVLAAILCALQTSTNVAQTPSPRTISSATPEASISSGSPATTATPTSSPDDSFLKEGLKGIADDSRTLTTWALTLIAGSILAIASTSYLRPANWKVRLIYLLFIPGWILCGISLFYGDQLTHSYGAAKFARSVTRLVIIGG